MRRTFSVYTACMNSIIEDAQTCNSISQEEEARMIYQQLLLALDYCHGMGISNIDTKLDNVLLIRSKKCTVIKLTSFVICNRDKDMAKPVVGTAMYMGMQSFRLKDYGVCGPLCSLCHHTHLSHHAPCDEQDSTPARPEASVSVCSPGDTRIWII